MQEFLCDVKHVCTQSALLRRKYDLWSNMRKRVRVSDNLIVCDRWLTCSSFIDDISTLPNYELWEKSVGEYALNLWFYDLENLVFSPSTCGFSNAVQVRQLQRNKTIEKNGYNYKACNHMSKSILVIFSDPEHTKQVFPSRAELASYLGITSQHLSDIMADPTIESADFGIASMSYIQKKPVCYITKGERDFFIMPDSSRNFSKEFPWNKYS